MDDLALGRLLRMRRLRRGWRLADVATSCRLAVATIGRGEHGAFGSLGVARRHAAALDVRLEWLPIARGVDLARTLDEEHAAIADVVATWLRRQEFEVVAEASFSIYGERGRIDLLAYAAASSTLAIVEVKTELGDLQDLFGAIDVRERLAPRIAGERGWSPSRRLTVLAVADTPRNRSIVGEHRALFGGWRRGVLHDGLLRRVYPRAVVWIPAAAAGRQRWLAGRRRMQ